MFLPAFYRSCLGILASAKSQNCGAKAICHMTFGTQSFDYKCAWGDLRCIIFSKLSLVVKTDYVRSSQSDLTVFQFQLQEFSDLNSLNWTWFILD